jgi:predicted N-acyltransferase
MILDAAETLCRKNKIAGIHILFPDPEWAEGLSSSDFVAWKHHHYEWDNPGFGGFQDYLAGFSKNQRKNIRRERMRPGEQDVEVRIIPGPRAKPEHFARMFDLYTITNDKFAPYDARYVNEKFFSLLEKNYRDRLLFVEAARGGEVLAQALLVEKNSGLWGRYWGAYEDVRDLHFEACYYAPIEHAIRQKISLFDPGAGSPHKIRRGFLAKPDFSYHRLFDPALDGLFRTNIDMVNRYEDETIEELNGESPLKRDAAAPV